MQTVEAFVGFTGKLDKSFSVYGRLSVRRRQCEQRRHQGHLHLEPDPPPDLHWTMLPIARNKSPLLRVACADRDPAMDAPRIIHHLTTGDRTG
jgi:hypothetical protein